jgi:hypothetical protein
MQTKKPTSPKEGKENDKRRIRVVIYFICVLLSTFFWLMIKLSQDYTIGIDVPVVFTGIPAEYAVSGQNVKTLHATVSDRGFELLRMYYTKTIDPVEISLKTVPYRKINQNEYFISSGNLKVLLAAHFGISENGIGMKDDQLSFRLDNLSTTVVNVIPDIQLSFRQQYGVFGAIDIEPKTLTVYGPASVMDTLKQIYTTTIIGTDVHETIKVSVVPELLGGLLQSKTNQVQVTIPVEQYTESSLLVNISIPEYARQLKTFPDKAEVFYLVPMKEFMKIQPSLFNIVLDTLGLYERRQLLNIRLDKSPQQIQIRHIHPIAVEYILVDK